VSTDFYTRFFIYSIISPVSSGAVFTTSPEVDKRRVEAVRSSVAQRAKIAAKLKSYESGSPEYVQTFRDAILNTVGYSMDRLKTSMGQSATL